MKSMFSNLREILYKAGHCPLFVAYSVGHWPMYEAVSEYTEYIRTSRNQCMTVGLVFLTFIPCVSQLFSVFVEFYLYPDRDRLNIYIKHAFPLCTINIL